MVVSNKNISNHLTNGYSDFVMKFLVKYNKELSLKNKILDVGCGHYRNLKLFEELGFKKLYGIDRNISPNPLNVSVNFIQRDIQEGLLFNDKEFDIVLCNYVLMFIKPEKMNFVVNELLRVSKGFMLIETYPQKSSGIFYEDYEFKDISKIVKDNKNFQVLQEQIYYEKLLVRRKDPCLEVEKANM